MLNVMQNCLRHVLLGLSALMLLVAEVQAGAALAIPASEPSEWYAAGSATSLTNRSWDIDAATLPASPVPSASLPAPLIQQDLKFKIWRDTAGQRLRVKVQVTDNSWKSGPDQLPAGDRLVIQFDGDGSGGATLQAGDSKYELTLNFARSSDQIVQRLYSVNTSTSNWSVTPQSVNFATTSSASGPTSISLSGNLYDIDLAIPYAQVGISSSVTSIGMALGWANDLGYRNAQNQAYYSGAALPADLLITDQSQPGFSGALANGQWKNPSAWLRAYLGTAPTTAAGIQFSHIPAYYFSDSIRLGICTALSFDQIQAPDPGNPGAQSALANWYQYHPAAPCKMALWFKPEAVGAAGQVRFLIMWNDAGLGNNQTWRTIALTQPIQVTPGKFTFMEFWGKVPKDGSSSTSSTHPCVRIYAIPAALKPGWDEARLLAIVDAGELGNFQNDFGKQPQANVDFTTAQMNFTNLSSGSCPGGICPADVSLRDPLRLAATDTAIGQYLAQSTTTGGVIGGPGKDEQPNPGKAKVGVFVNGFGVPAVTGNLPYTFVNEIGGLGWAIPYQAATSESPPRLAFVVGNPALSGRDFTTIPPTPLPGAKQRITLQSTVQSPPGMPLVQLNLPTGPFEMEPGQIRTVEASVGRSCNCACLDLTCQWRCRVVAANESEYRLSGSLAGIGVLGLGLIAFIRRHPRSRPSDNDA